MPTSRCGCASDRCSCFIVAGPGVSLTGTGSQADPYVVSREDEGQEVGSDGRFVGEIIAFGGVDPPSSKYLPADGRALSRTAFATLFGIYGTLYGAGDGSSTFNLPDLRDRSPMGTSSVNDPGAKIGADTVNLTTGMLPAHTHSMNHGHTEQAAGVHDHDIQRSSGTGSGAATFPKGTTLDTTSRLGIADDGSHTHTINDFTGNTGSRGNGDPVPTRTPSLAIPHYVKVLA